MSSRTPAPGDVCTHVLRLRAKTRGPALSKISLVELLATRSQVLMHTHAAWTPMKRRYMFGRSALAPLLVLAVVRGAGAQWNSMSAASTLLGKESEPAFTSGSDEPTLRPSEGATSALPLSSVRVRLALR